jgi:hypothetical protein
MLPTLAGQQHQNAIGKGGQVFNVKAYGAVGDGKVDDTDAIRATIAAAGVGNIVFFPKPPVSYLVSGNGKEIFLLTYGVTIMGEGPTTYIGVSAQVPPTTDVFRIAPANARYAATNGYTFRDLAIIPVTGTPGRFGINFDTSAFEMTLEGPVVEDCRLGPFGAQAIATTNYSTTRGAFHGQVRQSHLFGGVLLDRVGDQWEVADNILDGGNYGITISCIPGAGGLSIRNNFCTSRGGFLHIRYANGALVSGNTYQGVVSSPNHCIVDISGDLAQVTSVVIDGENRFVADNVDVDCIRVNAARGTFIDGNQLSTRGKGKSIAITALGRRTHIGGSNELSGPIADAGVGTTYAAQVVASKGELIWPLTDGLVLYSPTSRSQLTIRNAGNTDSQVAFQNAVRKWTIRNASATGNLQLLDGSADKERVTVDANGNVGIGTVSPTSRLQVSNLPVYANNAAAMAGGLTAGAFYRTGSDPDQVCVVH